MYAVSHVEFANSAISMYFSPFFEVQKVQTSDLYSAAQNTWRYTKSPKENTFLFASLITHPTKISFKI